MANLAQTFSGKHCVVTGAASGIGRSLCSKLSDMGARITAVDLNEAGLQTLKESIRSEIEIIPCDLSNRENRDKLMERLSGGAPIDFFFANAGLAFFGGFEDKSISEIRAVTEINWLAPLEAFHHLLKYQSTPFRFVMTASAMSFVGMPRYAVYAGLKSALHAFGDTYRYEENNKGSLTLVYPVATRTSFFKKEDQNTRIPWPAQTAEQVAEAILKGCARGRKEIFPSSVFFSLNILSFLHRLLFAPYRAFYAK